LLLNKEQVVELDYKGVQRMIESLCIKVEELTGLIKTATIVASKAELEGRSAMVSG
jgi:hypothetical protein